MTFRGERGARMLAARMDTWSRKARRSFTTSFDAEAERAKAHAIRLTSGGLSAGEQQRMGHPYARRRPMLPGLPVNVQRGHLRAGWRVFRHVSERGARIVVQNVARLSGIILAPGGTRTMIARGVVAEVNRRARQRTRLAARRAAREVLRGF